MSTHAKYVLWIGVWYDDLENIPEGFSHFLMLLDNSSLLGGVQRGDYKYSAVRMHGETIGYGVVCDTLEWVTTEERPTSPDFDVYLGLANRRKFIEEYLRRAGLPAEVRVEIYHHLDLDL